MNTRYGTHHFVSRAAAIRYYARQGIDAHDVDEMLKEGAIAFGAPTPPPGNRVIIEPSEGRYFIEEDPNEPTWENQLRHARRVLKDKGRKALDNPHGMIGRTCGCGTCFCCAAAQVLRDMQLCSKCGKSCPRTLNICPTCHPTPEVKELICNALAAWIRKRPGLNPRDYFGETDRGKTLAAGVAAYRSMQREVGREKHHAETLLAAVRARDSITTEALQEAFRRAFAGRLSCDLNYEEGQQPPYSATLEYTAGQDPHTEYRAAAAAVLANALWYATVPEVARNAQVAESEVHADLVRQHFRKEFGSALQRRWFNS